MQRLNFISRLWDYRVEEVNAFLENTEKGISSVYKKYSNKLNAYMEDMSEKEQEEYVDIKYDDIAMIRDVTPQMLRQAQYLLLFGLFEHEVAGLCRCLYHDGKCADKPRKNLYLANSQEFLIQEAGYLKKTFKNKSWNFMLKARLAKCYFAD